MTISVICHTDMDGYSSAAIIGNIEKDLRIFPINYGQPIRFDKLPLKSKVYMVDFTAELEEMERLVRDYDFVWIDHHMDAVDIIEAKLGKNIPGSRVEGLSACILTWTYFYPDSKVPQSLLWLDAFDTGKYDLYKETRPFQKGLWAMDVFPVGRGKMILWRRIFHEQYFQEKIIERGVILLEAEESEYKNKCRFMVEEVDFHGHLAILANFGLGDPELLRSVIDPERHELIIGYYKYSKLQLDGTYIKYWKFSVRTIKERSRIDVGDLLRTHYGGGGHPKAGGFQVEFLSDLPWMSNIIRPTLDTINIEKMYDDVMSKDIIVENVEVPSEPEKVSKKSKK